MFGWLKKKKEQLPEYDPSNITLLDLRMGFVLDYQGTSWEVVAEYEYDWGDNYFTYEYKLKSSNDAIFLGIEEDDELVCTVSRKIKFSSLDQDIEEHIREHEIPPKKIKYEGVKYKRETEKPGYFRDVMTTDHEDAEHFIAWEYYDQSERKVLGIEQWNENSFECWVGVLEEPYLFTNILPGRD